MIVVICNRAIENAMIINCLHWFSSFVYTLHSTQCETVTICVAFSADSAVIFSLRQVFIFAFFTQPRPIHVLVCASKHVYIVWWVTIFVLFLILSKWENETDIAKKYYFFSFI